MPKYLSPPTPPAQHRYRPEIDGMRALAVVAVVLFHAFPELPLRGGFTGVDLFFVISGYLISQIIVAQLAGGCFSLSQFYGRRVRRIFPALICVLGVTFVLGWCLFLAHEFKQLGQHVFAGAAFFSNFLLLEEVGYFDSAAESKPLLHLWSLGIEEQFYIFWPLCVALIFRLRRGGVVITALAGISFLLACERVVRDPSAAFYLPHLRMWELLCGALLAWCVQRGATCGAAGGGLCERLCIQLHRWSEGQLGRLSWIPSTLAMGGAALFLAGCVVISRDAQFPGWWALLPVVGALSVLAAGPAAWLNRVVLSQRGLVAIGMISYPLYLWHWPLLSVARVVLGSEPPLDFRFLAVVVAFVLAALTYRFVEGPLRFGGRSRLKISALSGVLLVCGVAGWGAHLADGVPSRRAASASELKGDVGHVEFHRAVAERYFRCTPEEVAAAALTYQGYLRCMQSKRDAELHTVLLGDSHAESIFLGVAEAISQRNVGFYIANGAPYVGNPQFTQLFSAIRKNPHIRHVVVGIFYAERLKDIPPGSSLELELVKLYDEVVGSSDRRFSVLGDVPLFPFSAEGCKRRPLWWLTQQRCEISAEYAARHQAFYQGSLQRFLQMRPAAAVLNLDRYFCEKDGSAGCSMRRGDTILYRDPNHLNVPGSLYAGRRLVEDNQGRFQ